MNYLTLLQSLLAGKKTYGVGALLVLYGVAVLLGWVEPPVGGTFDHPAAVGTNPIEMILQGLGLGTLRAGIAKNGNGAK